MKMFAYYITNYLMNFIIYLTLIIIFWIGGILINIRLFLQVKIKIKIIYIFLIDKFLDIISIFYIMGKFFNLS